VFEEALYPNPDRRQEYPRTVGYGEFVVPSGQGSPLLGQREGSLDNVASAVHVGIEAGRSAALAAFAMTGSDLVTLKWDHDLDPAAVQHMAGHSGCVGLVCDHRVGSGTGPASTSAWNSDVVQDLLEHRAVVASAAGDHHRQRAALAVDGMMDLRRQPATGPTDAVTCRFNVRQRQFLVIRQCPLCPDRGGSCLSRAGEHG